MQEKESIMVIWCELKIPSLGITNRTVILVTEFSVSTSQPLKILIFYHHVRSQNDCELVRISSLGFLCNWRENVNVFFFFCFLFFVLLLVLLLFIFFICLFVCFNIHKSQYRVCRCVGANSVPHI